MLALRPMGATMDEKMVKHYSRIQDIETNKQATLKFSITWNEKKSCVSFCIWFSPSFQMAVDKFISHYIFIRKSIKSLPMLMIVIMQTYARQDFNDLK